MSLQALRLQIRRDQYRFVKVFHWKSTDHDLKIVPRHQIADNRKTLRNVVLVFEHLVGLVQYGWQKGTSLIYLYMHISM